LSAGAGQRRHQRVYRVEPRHPIGVGQRLAAVHLLDIGRRMEIVGVVERPSELMRQQPTDGGLAAARDSHEDGDHRRSLSVVR
jgi:hypothetical protein